MDKITRKTVRLKYKFTWRIKMNICHFNISMHFLPFFFTSSSSSFSFSSFFLSFSSFDLQFSFLDYLFIWRPISDLSVSITDPQHKLQGDSSRQPNSPLLAPYFPQNHVELNEGELVLPLTRLHLHKSFQADDEVSFQIPLQFLVFT